MQITLQLDTNSSRDLSLLTLILNHTTDTLERMKPQSVGEQLERAAAIPGNPLNLKQGAPENKLANLVEESAESRRTSLPIPTVGERMEMDAERHFASTMTPAELASATLRNAIENSHKAPDEADKPKRGRKPKVEVAKTVTADEVRALMVEKSKAGAEEIARQKRILSSMGYEKLSMVPPERLVELKEKIEAAA